MGSTGSDDLPPVNGSRILSFFSNLGSAFSYSLSDIAPSLRTMSLRVEGRRGEETCPDPAGALSGFRRKEKRLLDDLFSEGPGPTANRLRFRSLPSRLGDSEPEPSTFLFAPCEEPGRERDC